MGKSEYVCSPASTLELKSAVHVFGCRSVHALNRGRRLCEGSLNARSIAFLFHMRGAVFTVEAAHGSGTLIQEEELGSHSKEGAGGKEMNNMHGLKKSNLHGEEIQRKVVHSLADGREQRVHALHYFRG
jgi:hypothetical protein